MSNLIDMEHTRNGATFCANETKNPELKKKYLKMVEVADEIIEILKEKGQ